jgi:endonuclease-3
MARRSDWKPPPPRRLRTILERLRREYGRPATQIHGAPIDELVLTVLSQNTNDRNRDVAYERLRDRFPSWEAVREAPPEEIVEAIRPGGLAVTKAPRIQKILDAISTSGSMDLSWMAEAPVEQARDYFCELPGVGRKTAACVLLFSYGRHDVPVDTHVHRVGTRLGLFREGASLDECHDEMLRLSRGADPLEAHVALIRHGRRICHARKPQCAGCPLLRMCPYGRGEAGPGALARTRPPH